MLSVVPIAAVLARQGVAAKVRGAITASRGNASA
jgi:hypothetical protein